MKQLQILSITVLFATVSLFQFSCKKEPAKVKTAQEMLLGKWTLVSEITNDFYGGMPHITIVNFPPGDFIDFKADWTGTKLQNGVSTTFTYSLIYYSKLHLGGMDFFDLKVFTETNLELYKKEIAGSDYKETTILLKR